MSSGRKSKLTQELINKLSKKMAEYPIRYACPLIGIAEKTFYNWTDAAEELESSLDSGDIKEEDLTQHQELLLAFLQSTQEARARLEIPYYETWRRAAKRWKDAQTGTMKNGNWNAAKEMLARLNPKDWGSIPPQQLAEMYQSLSGNEALPPVIATPGFGKSDDPTSQFLQFCAAQQQATKDFTAKKQSEDGKSE